MREKILIPTILLTILMSVVISYTLYYAARTSLIEEASKEAESCAKIAAGEIDTELYQKIVIEGAESEAYLYNIEELRHIQKNSNIMFLYTLNYFDDKLCYVLDTDSSEERSMIGDVAGEEQEDCIKQEFSRTPYVANHIEYTMWGDIISCYIPIKAENEIIIGVVGSYFDASDIVNTLNRMKKLRLLLV